MKTRALAILAVCLIASLAGCSQQTAKDLAEIRAKQDEILAKLTALEDGQKKLASAQRPQGPPSEDFDKIYAIGIEGSPVRGDANGPVTIVEFSDFQCPFCARAAPLIDDVLKKYPKGVRFVYKQFPLPMHAVARPAAHWSMAAQEQGKFWAMHDVLVVNQPTLDRAQIDGGARSGRLHADRDVVYEVEELGGSGGLDPAGLRVRVRDVPARHLLRHGLRAHKRLVGRKRQDHRRDVRIAALLQPLDDRALLCWRVLIR